MNESEFRRLFEDFAQENDDYQGRDYSYFYWQWSTGGVRGGSCWDTGEDNHYHYDSDETEPKVTVLDAFLIKYFPQITFLQFRQLAEIIEEDSDTESEYYGNYTNYQIRKVSCDKLYKKMCEFGCVLP